MRTRELLNIGTLNFLEALGSVPLMNMVLLILIALFGKKKMNWRPGNTSKVMNGKIGSLSVLLLEENNLHLQYCSHALLPPQLRELPAPFVFFLQGTGMKNLGLFRPWLHACCWIALL